MQSEGYQCLPNAGTVIRRPCRSFHLLQRLNPLHTHRVYGISPIIFEISHLSLKDDVSSIHA